MAYIYLRTMLLQIMPHCIKKYVTLGQNYHHYANLEKNITVFHTRKSLGEANRQMTSIICAIVFSYEIARNILSKARLKPRILNAFTCIYSVILLL